MVMQSWISKVTAVADSCLLNCFSLLPVKAAVLSVRKAAIQRSNAARVEIRIRAHSYKSRLL